jgi:hypothetical protein
MSMHGVDFAITEEESDSICLLKVDRLEPRGWHNIGRIKMASLQVGRSWRVPSLESVACFGQLQT